MIVGVRVKAGASRETQITISDKKMQIAVREPAQDNRANDRVRVMLAAHFGVPVRHVRLLRGQHHPSKLFEIGDAV